MRNRPEYGGGALYDVGCYPIVTARYVFGTEPDVSSPGRSRPETRCRPGDERLAGFPGGGQLLFSSAFQLAFYQRVVVLGTQGRIELPVPFTPPIGQASRI